MLHELQPVANVNLCRAFAALTGCMCAGVRYSKYAMLCHALALEPVSEASWYEYAKAFRLCQHAPRDLLQSLVLATVDALGDRYARIPCYTERVAALIAVETQRSVGRRHIRLGSLWQEVHAPVHGRADPLDRGAGLCSPPESRAGSAAPCTASRSVIVSTTCMLHPSPGDHHV